MITTLSERRSPLDQIIFIIGLTLFVFGAGMNVFLFTNYSRKLLYGLEQEQKKRQEEGAPAAAEAVEEEIILLRHLLPKYSRLFFNWGAILLGLHFILRIFG